ncbi:acetyl-CoA carboxylase, biotin carboxylase subunit [Atopostipes suicloacalis DSM 15692]|uniref:Biotin carboxylase n=1 Tax=Atopostipes suicloacalis DSM 15692 TaxID=1121025 RepID=A0A1M4UF73_9LACT|nr:acetyl-CoA carboxylase biotin carboxylase subunit [Atopostipes suicloacalis]SHE55306.1 acetyl-CoA carboxylase, biotin carboxylase subunit [Atopostipes suicloacalis DSM 15692]
MFQKVLVANRGEIAVRIIRALRELGITSVAVFSEADRYALHTELADEAICIGPAKGIDSYANPVAVLSAANVSGADAIHPGYGFLSERSDFASLCEKMNIKFIGPNSDIIRDMGNKQNARTTMREAGVPIVPGGKDLVENIEQARKIAEETGYPLMIKAADGGGGKGMRLASSPEELEPMFTQAQNETQSIYGNRHLYIERTIYPAKHIEVQILADEQGNVVHLGERDCSLQRNNQKVIEFAPSPTLSEETRNKLNQAAVDAAKAIGYTNAGTIEFLVDNDENFYFMEMNTRLQVEHPITEMVTGVDIVKAQIEIAAGQPLPFKQSDIELNGFAIECRLNAEDPYNHFQPSSGYIDRLFLPNGGMGLRVETTLYSNYTLPPFYDSMVAKIITHQPTREDAFKLMERALYEVTVEGLNTNIELLEALISHPEVQADNVHAKWLEEEFMPQWIEEVKEHSALNE